MSCTSTPGSEMISGSFTLGDRHQTPPSANCPLGTPSAVKRNRPAWHRLIHFRQGVWSLTRHHSDETGRTKKKVPFAVEKTPVAPDVSTGFNQMWRVESFVFIFCSSRYNLIGAPIQFIQSDQSVSPFVVERRRYVPETAWAEGAIEIWLIISTFCLTTQPKIN